MYIVPPKLQTKMLIGGLTVPECLIYLAAFLACFMFRLFGLLPVVGTLIILSWRFVNNRNALYFFVVLFRYYRKGQAFTRRL